MKTTNGNNAFPRLISNIELDSFKAKTDQLMLDLENNDITNAMVRIQEINEINGKSFYRLIGKLTRGLHHAISDLSISSNTDHPENNKARGDLKYVISLTDTAAKKTLDMTEHSRSLIHNLTETSTQQTQLLETYAGQRTLDKETEELLQDISDCSRKSSNHVAELNATISEIVIAQNFQDIASQSITKAINIIQEVENSLVALTQYANLLTKLSQYSGQFEGGIDLEDSEELKSDIGQFNDISVHEHLDQNDVDNLLSSLGF